MLIFKKRSYPLFLVLFLLAKISFAMPDDREKILTLSADSADLNQQTHQGEYIGNVQLDQGTTHLRAASARTDGDKQNKLVLAIAKGNKKEQAHFWVITELNKPALHAFADLIQYFPERNVVELIGNAKVAQGDNSFTAPKIIYDTVKQHVVSKSDGKTRTTIIIHPGKKA